MKIISHIVYVNWEELQEMGVPFKSIDSGTMRFRQGESSSWANIPDPEDKRRCLVEYASIPAATYKKYGLKPEAELRAAAEQAQSQAQSQALQRLLPPCPRADVEYLQGYQIHREEIDLETGMMVPVKSAGLPQATLQSYLEQCRWLSLMASAQVEDKRLQNQLGTKGKVETLMKLRNLAEEAGVKLPTAYNRLLEKVNNYREQGAACVVNQRFGNRNAIKIEGLGLEYLLMLQGDPRKFDTHSIWRMYNEEAQRSGLFTPVAESTIRHNLARPELKPLWIASRDGEKAFANKYGHQLKTRQASYRDALWVVDGTKVNLYYKDVKGETRARLNMIVVMDSYSKAFIGYHISDKPESAEGVAAALKMALEKTGNRVPHQVLWDNSGPNQKFFKNWGGLGFPAQPYNAKAKPIEGAFAAYQEKVLRVNPNFTGMNITAHGERARPNVEYIESQVLPSLEKAIKQTVLSLEAYNRLAHEKTGESPLGKYEASQHREKLGEPLTLEDEIHLFWQWRTDKKGNIEPVVYGNGGLTLQTGEYKRSYEVYKQLQGSVGVPDFDFLNAHIGRSFWVKVEPFEAGQRIALYLGENLQDARYVAVAHSKVTVARAVMDMQPGERSTIEASLGTRKAQYKRAKLSQEERKRQLEELLGTGVDEPMLNTLKDAYHEAESRMVEAEIAGFDRRMDEAVAAFEAENEEVYVPVSQPTRLLTAQERAEEAYQRMRGNR